MSFYNDLIENYLPEGVKLPKRLQEFFDNNEFEDHDGRYVGGLHNYSDDARIAIRFGESELEELFEGHSDSDLANEADRSTFMPFAGLDDSQYLAVKIMDSKCPVYMWEHEDGNFYEHSSSLDEFLESLHDTKEVD